MAIVPIIKSFSLMFTKFPFKTALAVGAFAIALSLGLVSCDKNSQDQPTPAVSTVTAAKLAPFDIADIIEIEDDADEDAANARTAAVTNPATYRIKHTGSCGADVAIVYIAQSVSTTTLADSTRSKTFPKGSWKSFTIKAANLNKVVGKTLDKTQTYTFYVRNKTAKTATKLQTISALGTADIFQATETKGYSNTLFSWSACN